MNKHFNEVRPYLELAELMGISSTSSNKPYSATVFFCFDEELNIYFLSTSQRRHSKEIVENPNVALTIASHKVEWGKIMNRFNEGLWKSR